MSPSPTSTKLLADPDRVAILSLRQRQGEVAGCDALLARVRNGRVELLDSKEIIGSTALVDARLWIEQNLAARTIVMLAGSDVVCRTMKMPSASADQLEMALRLQVENLLVGGAARWRTNAVLLPTSDPERERAALMVEWPLASAGPAIPSSLVDQLDISFAPPIAALVALVTGSISDGGPESLAVHLERSTGAISIAYSDGIHGAFRTVREDGTDEAEWKAAILRSTIETLLLANVPEHALNAAVGSLEAALHGQSDGLLAPLSSGVSAFEMLADKLPTDAIWWTRYGLLLGTAIALSGPLARISTLKARARVADENLRARMVRAASTPRIATRLAVAALLVAAIVPPAFSGSRLLYLNWMLPDSDAYERALTRSDQQTAMYREIEKYAWPTSKLLADLSSTTPEGIELESIALNQGSALDLHGNAKPQGSSSAADAILLMERQLVESRIFSRIEKHWDAPNQNGVISFDMKATVTNPTLIPNFPEAQDFARRTLRDRRYGVAESTTRQPSIAAGSESTQTAAGEISESQASSVARSAASGATPAGPAITSSSDAASGPDRESIAQGGPEDSKSSKRRGTGSGTVAPGATRRGSGGSESATPIIPDPLTNEQIAAMSQTEAREALGKVSIARGIPGIDEASEARLKAEFYRLLEQARKQ
ncbi:MAG: hypothetical protein EXS01_01655 [Phycisphaerales bacterium]|nr:hypothetical protein [Phycisphaerales bacterium]